MDALIKAHQQAKQKQTQANVLLNDLQTREKELKEKISGLSSHASSAERQLSRALTSDSLEKASAVVEEARKSANDAQMLLKNIERAINDINVNLPTLHNDVRLAELDIWAAQEQRLIQEMKAQQDVLSLIMKAYVAAWQQGYRWEIATFIREKILGAGTHIDPEVLAQLKDEMTKQILLGADVSAKTDEKAAAFEDTAGE
ncbi:MAG: hypothetical protein ABIO50_04210 [Nitrosospira sp.]